MKKEDAIKYLHQLYPNGGHCWLDEQRIEAIGMAINALQKEPISDDLEEAAEEYAYTNWQSDDYHDGAAEGLPFDAIGHTQKTFKAGAKWQKAKLMKDAIDAVVHIDAGNYPYISEIELYDYDKDIPLAKKGEKYKVVLIKKD